jgi:hypothetical protein
MPANFVHTSFLYITNGTRPAANGIDRRLKISTVGLASRFI